MVVLQGGPLPEPITHSVPAKDRTAWRDLAHRLHERFGISLGDTLNTLQEALNEAKAKERDARSVAPAESRPVDAPADFRPTTSSTKSEFDFQPVIINLEEVVARPVEWLWDKRIPLGRITLLVGKPGQGKSFLTCDFAARVTTGTPWPDGTPCQKGSVLMLTLEDDPADTIRPRLDAMHADVARVRILKAVNYRDIDGVQRQRGLTLADLPVIEKALESLSDCRLLVIDPIGDFLGGRVDSHRDNEIRAVLTPLAELARRRKVAVLVVMHRRKSAGDGGADDTAMGSRGFTGIARSVWHVTRDANDKKRRLFLPGKQNLAEELPGLAFRIAGEPPHVEWEREPVNISADEGLEAERQASRPGPEADALEDAKAFLLAALSAGPRLAKDVRQEWMEAHCGSEKTLKRAKITLGIMSYREKVPGPWFWRLPEGEHCKDTGGTLQTQITLQSLQSLEKTGVLERSRGQHCKDTNALEELCNVGNGPEHKPTENPIPTPPESGGTDSGDSGRPQRPEVDLKVPGPWWWKLPEKQEGQDNWVEGQTQITWPSWPSLEKNGVFEVSSTQEGQDAQVIGELGPLVSDPACNPTQTPNTTPPASGGTDSGDSGRPQRPEVDLDELNRRLAEATEQGADVWLDFS
ncbi:MAG: AAA family ATPase [Thermogutta sp.]